jgi:hypothetical protein
MSLTIQLPSTTTPTDEILNRALSDTVSSLFIKNAPLPFSSVEINSVPQEVQPVPFKWQTEVAIEDDAVFAPQQQMPPIQPPVRSPISSSGWTGSKFFEAALDRLGLDISSLTKMSERDDELFRRFGADVDSLSRMKKIIKNELKEYDNAFKAETGREPSRIDKEPMRLLYTVYRKLRDIIVKVEAQSSVPVPSPQVAGLLPIDPERVALEERLDALLLEKQNVRAILQEYQSRFMQEQGRRIKYHRDIVGVDREYRQYKQLKEEINKLEAQLGRRSSSASKSNDIFA